MGRGRQKAKHTKVARELKYFSPNTDLTALEKEIGHIVPTPRATGIDAEPEYEDKWADLYAMSLRLKKSPKAKNNPCYLGKATLSWKCANRHHKTTGITIRLET